jgi:hypothetical protein
MTFVRIVIPFCDYVLNSSGPRVLRVSVSNARFPDTSGQCKAVDRATMARPMGSLRPGKTRDQDPWSGKVAVVVAAETAIVIGEIVSRIQILLLTPKVLLLIA